MTYSSASLKAIKNYHWQQIPHHLLATGYPLLVFLLLAFHSTSYALSALTILSLIYLLFTRHSFFNAAKNYSKSPLFLCAATIIAYVACSSLWSSPPFLHTPKEQLRAGAWILVFWTLSCGYFLHINTALKRIFWTIGLGILSNIFGKWLHNNGHIFEEGRLIGQGILNNPILLASVAAIQTTIGLNLKSNTLAERITTGIMLCTALTIIMLSLSRGPILSMIAAIAIWFACRPTPTSTRKLIIGCIAFGITVVTAHLTGLWDTLLERGTSLRPLIWQQSILAAESHWISGWGWINDFSQSVVNQHLIPITGIPIIHPHGLLISSLYYGGVIGFILHALLFFLLLQQAYKSKSKGLAFGLVISIALLTATDSFSVVTKRDYMWIIFWIPLAILYSLDMRHKDGSTPSINHLSIKFTH